jgi:hypothetical protein
MNDRERQIRDSEKIVVGCCIAFLVILGIVWIQSLILGL